MRSWLLRGIAVLTILSAANVLAQTAADLPGSSETTKIVAPAQAVILGLVEGITEYLPVSSTGHLVLADQFLGLRDTEHLSPDEIDAIEAYEIVIQAGAILAVLLLYAAVVKQMLLGLVGRSESGRKLLINVIAAFIPTAIVGLLINKIIKEYLQSTGPVIAALLVGGVVMILFERTHWARKARTHGQALDFLNVRAAVVIGFCQCLAMWPGTSRSMVTILSGMVFGLSPVAAAEFSFILGLPTLLAATVFKLHKEGHVLMAHIGVSSMTIGLVVAAIAAVISVRSFVFYLNRHGFVPFGWYRVVLAGIMYMALGL